MPKQSHIIIAARALLNDPEIGNALAKKFGTDFNASREARKIVRRMLVAIEAVDRKNVSRKNP